MENLDVKQIVKIKPELILKWIGDEDSLEEVKTLSSRNLYKNKYGINLKDDFLIPSDEYLLLSCIKTNLFMKDLKVLFDSDLNILDKKFYESNSIHEFLVDILKCTKKELPENYDLVLNQYLEVLCLAINNDMKLSILWNSLYTLFE